MHLVAEPSLSGKLVQCPGCSLKFQVPSFDATEQAVDGYGTGGAHKPQRKAWKEEDPTNPNAKISVGIGIGLTLIWFAIVYPFQAAPGKATGLYTGMEVFANIFYKHFTISFANVLFFCWGAAILFLKHRKLKRQRDAMLLDVLPMELGKEINAQNVGAFIDHVYGLPERLRDSMMVNRIRKALEFFEVRQNVSDLGTLMSSQSGVDGSRISGSYIIVRAFLWAIPLLGFIGTVIGLSHALSGMSFSEVEDVGKVVASISNVTSGLGTAFDATLLGLVLAVTLNFPLNQLSKEEDEALNDIDAYCNEVLLPRLNDGSGAGGGDLGAVADSVVRALSSAQSQFLTDLNALSTRMLEYSDNLDRRTAEHQQVALHEFSTQMAAMRSQVEHLLGEATRLTNEQLGESTRIANHHLGESTRIANEHLGESARVANEHLGESVRVASLHLASLDAGIQSLNRVLKDLGEKQVVIQQVKKKGWFSRD
jgi:flagellar motor component MotA